MKKNSKKIQILVVFSFLVLFLVFVLLISCSKEEKKPKIVGCNTIEYDGSTYSNVGCAPGIRSFNYQITTNGNQSPCFHIECSGGCISSVSMCSGGQSLQKTVVGPEEEP